MSTLAYGTGTGYALGAANTITTVNYENSIQKKTTLTTNAYQWWDGAAQSTITFDSDTASGTNPINTSTYYYANVGGQGQLKSVAVADGRARTITFRNDSDGAALRRDEADAFTSNGDPHEIWYRFGARQLGYSGNNGTRETDYNASIANRTATLGSGAFFNGSTTSVAQGDFDQSLNPITSYDQGSSGGAYSVREGDTLAGLAERLWGDASLWWKIAEANGLTGQAALVEGQALTLPAGVMRATHNAQTFQPYDPSETLGDTAPTTLQPTPKKNKCGVFGRIFLVVIAVAVAAITKDFLTAGRILSVGAKVAVAAVSGATGSIVSQGVGVATGIQDKFSWNAVALAAIGGGVGASGVGDKFANALGVTSKTGVVAVSGAFNSALTQGIGVATGLQDKFDWAGVAAAGVGAYVGAHAADHWVGANASDFTRSLVANTASGLANAAVRTLIDGSDFGDNILAALPDVLGQTIGGAFADGISGASKPKPLTAAKIELFAPMEEANYSPLTELADIIDMPTFDIAMPRQRAAASGDFDWGAVWADVRESESMRLLREAQDARSPAGAGNALFSPDMVETLHATANVAHRVERWYEGQPESIRRAIDAGVQVPGLMTQIIMRAIAPEQYDEMMGHLEFIAGQTVEEFQTWNDANLANGLYTQQTFDDLRTLAPYAVTIAGVLLPGGRALSRIHANGYRFEFDDLGRVGEASGQLRLNLSQTRNGRAQLAAGGADRLTSDQGGHFIGRRFDGPTTDFNHFAQDGNFNMGAYRALEDQWARALEQGSTVHVRITPTYSGSSLRPASIMVTYQVNSQPSVTRRFTNQRGG